MLGRRHGGVEGGHVVTGGRSPAPVRRVQDLLRRGPLQTEGGRVEARTARVVGQRPRRKVATVRSVALEQGLEGAFAAEEDGVAFELDDPWIALLVGGAELLGGEGDRLDSPAGHEREQ